MAKKDQCFEAAASLFEAVLVKQWSRVTAPLWMKQLAWQDVYNAVREKQFYRVKGILVNTYGKDNFRKRIDDKTLGRLYCVVNEIERYSVVKRNHFLDRPSCSILALVSIMIEQCKPDLKIDKYQVEVLLNICSNNVEKLRELLCMGRLSGSLVNIAACCKGMTPIHFAVLWDNTESLQVLLKYIGNREFVNQKDVYSFTALHHAVQYSSLTVVRILLQYGADINSRLQLGHTPLHLAAYHVIPVLVFLLCQQEADVSAVNSSGETPLIMATRSGRCMSHERLHVTTLSLLLRFGSSPNTQDKHGRTPLFYVSRYCRDSRCAAILCSAGAKMDFLHKTWESNIPIVLKDKANDLPGIKVRRFLAACEQTPLRLELCCLIKVRKVMGKSFHLRVKELPLTRKLKKMLLFQLLPNSFRFI